MISHQHKCIFIHQRKCAGTFIIRSFGFTTKDEEWHFMNNGVLCQEFYDRPLEYTVFSIIRNPWDRFVSGWLYCEDTKQLPLRTLLRNLPQSGHDYSHVTRLQRDILHAANGRLVTQYLMRFEKLEREWEIVSGLIGKPFAPLTTENKNPTEKLHYREYFKDPIDRDLFMKHFARDVETFEYEF